MKYVDKRRTTIHFTSLVAAFPLFVVTVCSCDRFPAVGMGNYNKAVISGFAKFPQAMEMEKLFGEGDHFISSPGPTGTRDWNSVVYFGGRYTLTMQVEVKTDADFGKITDVVGKPLFVLEEARRIIRSPSGTTTGASFSNDWKFGVDDWKKVVDAKGDFGVIGIKTRNDEPLEGFDAYVKAVRAPRIRVRPK
jgi:hypothetical protein